MLKNFILLCLISFGATDISHAAGMLMRVQQMKAQKQHKGQMTQEQYQQYQEYQEQQQGDQSQAQQAIAPPTYQQTVDQRNQAIAQAILNAHNQAVSTGNSENGNNNGLINQVQPQATSYSTNQQPMAPSAGPSSTQDVVDLSEVWKKLDKKSKVWAILIDDQAKLLTVSEYIDRYRQEGVKINQPPMHYVQMIDQISGGNPQMLERPFGELLQILAIVDYDFDNGMDKDVLARKVLGDAGYEANKKRFKQASHNSRNNSSKPRPMKKYILSIDQGTTGSRAFIFDAQGRVVSSAYREFKQYYPKPGWVEHDAQEIWDSVERVIRRAVASSRIDPKMIAAIGITNQRETAVMWDRRTSKPVYRAIVWQCRRTADICTKLQKHADLFRKTTGLVVDAYFSGTKIQWLLDHVKGLRGKAAQGHLAFGTIDSWLINRLTNGAHVTDMTNASRTLIFDIKARAWSKPLLRLLNIPENILPKVLPSASIFGHTSKGVAGLPDGIPITAVMGDQQAALYGQGCFLPGSIKNTYGTGCFMLLNTGNKCVYSKKGLLTTLGCDAHGQPVYVLEGAVFIAGAVVQWLRDELKIIKDPSATEGMIAGLESTNGVYVVPAFVGLGAPYWNADARGIITGLTRGANARHIVRAALESMAYQTKDVFDLMHRESGIQIKSLSVDGGACRNNFLMQFQADILSIPMVRPLMVDSTAAGAAYLAGVGIGLWKPQDVVKIKRIDRIFKPKMPRSESNIKYDGWCHAVRQALVK